MHTTAIGIQIIHSDLAMTYAAEKKLQIQHLQQQSRLHGFDEDDQLTVWTQIIPFMNQLGFIFFSPSNDFFIVLLVKFAFHSQNTKVNNTVPNRKLIALHIEMRG
jgi:hypothetical protein